MTWLAPGRSSLTTRRSPGGSGSVWSEIPAPEETGYEPTKTADVMP